MQPDHRNVPSDTPTLDFVAHWALFAVLAVLALVYVRRARARPSRGRLLLGNGLVFVSLFALAVACGETYLRFGYDATMWHAESLTTRAWLQEHCALNRDGFRDGEFTKEKPPGTTRMAVLGDSFTFGYGVADPADRFPDLLEARAPGNVEVWNVGSIGANTGAEIEILRSLIASVDLDRVLVAYSPNDVEDLLPLERHDVAPFEGARPGSLRSRSYLLDHVVIRTSLLDASYRQGFYDEVDAFHRDPARFAPQAARIAEMARLCRDAGLRLDVAVWPLVSHWGPDYPFDAWHDRIAEAWAAAGVEVIDLREALAGTTYEDLRVNALDAHPNERAQRLVAEYLLPRLF